MSRARCLGDLRIKETAASPEEFKATGTDALRLGAAVSENGVRSDWTFFRSNGKALRHFRIVEKLQRCNYFATAYLAETSGLLLRI